MSFGKAGPNVDPSTSPVAGPFLISDPSRFHLLQLRARQAGDLDELILLKDGEAFLLKEQKNAPEGRPVRIVLRIGDEHIAVFFHNREVEILPRDDSTLKLLAAFGVFVYV